MGHWQEFAVPVGEDRHVFTREHETCRDDGRDDHNKDRYINSLHLRFRDVGDKDTHTQRAKREDDTQQDQLKHISCTLTPNIKSPIKA